jgi:hypothetical protein
MSRLWLALFAAAVVAYAALDPIVTLANWGGGGGR